MRWILQDHKFLQIKNARQSLLSDVAHVAEQFHKGKSYSTLNTYRSAILFTLHLIKAHNFGDQPYVSRYFKGVFVPRYSFIYGIFPNSHHTWLHNL